MGRATLWLSLSGLAAACASGEDVGGSASPTSFTSASASASASATASATVSDSGSDSATDDDGSAGDADSGDADSGDSDPSADAGSDSAAMGPGMQPEDGMYSDCLTAGQCVGLNTCVTILDVDNNPTDGFCSNNACEDPAAECDPTPAGDTVPFCMSLVLNGVDDTVCALDCSGDTPCPGGMICWDLGGVSVCA